MDFKYLPPRLGSVLLLLFVSIPAEAGKVLVIGDSHTCGSFGQGLSSGLIGGNDEVEVFCTSSSNPTHWMRGANPRGVKCKTWTNAGAKRDCGGDGRVPTLAGLLESKRYDRVVVAHGSNSLYSPQVNKDYGAMAELIAKHGATCSWIGPPHMRPDQAKGFAPASLKRLEANLPGFYDSLKRNVGSRCELIDSREHTRRGQPGWETYDGVHRGAAAGMAWGKAVAGLVGKQNGLQSEATPALEDEAGKPPIHLTADYGGTGFDPVSPKADPDPYFSDDGAAIAAVDLVDCRVPSDRSLDEARDWAKGIHLAAVKAQTAPADGAEEVKSLLASQGFDCSLNKHPAKQGFRCRGRIRGYSQPVNIYIPPHFQMGRKFSLAYHFMGWTTNPSVNPFTAENGDYGAYFSKAGKNALLVVPESLGKNHTYTTDLGTSSQMNNFFERIDEVLKRARVNAGPGTPKVISGHSGAYVQLGRMGEWAKSGEVPHLKNLHGVAFFDSLYGNRAGHEKLLEVMEENKTVNLLAAYNGADGSASKAAAHAALKRRIKGQAGVRFDDSRLPHMAFMREYMTGFYESALP